MFWNLVTGGTINRILALKDNTLKLWTKNDPQCRLNNANVMMSLLEMLVKVTYSSETKLVFVKPPHVSSSVAL